MYKQILDQVKMGNSKAFTHIVTFGFSGLRALLLFVELSKTGLTLIDNTINTADLLLNSRLCK